MANERDNKTRPSSGVSDKAPRPKSNPNAEISAASAATAQSTSFRKPVSNSETATTSTARNATIQGNAVISSDDVRQRAYELYEKRGRLEGFHEQDWHQAEAEVRNRKDGGQTGSRKKSA